MSNVKGNGQGIDRESSHYRQLINDGLESMSQAALEINQHVAGQRRRISEPLFRETLLPIIRAHATGAFPELSTWLTLANGTNNEIDVVDENNTVLFVVPPPFSKIPERDTAPEPGKRFSTINHLVQAQADMLDNGDTRGVMGVDRDLVELCSPRPEHAEQTKNLSLLVKIYDRYDLPLNEILGEAADEIGALLRANKGKETVEKSAPEVEQYPEDDDLMY